MLKINSVLVRIFETGLIVAAVLFALLGWFDQNFTFIGLATVWALLARIAQAYNNHSAMMYALGVLASQPVIVNTEVVAAPPMYEGIPKPVIDNS